MTRDDIIEWLQTSELINNSDSSDVYLIDVLALERFAALVAEREREACAKLCDLEYAACWSASAMAQARQAQRCAEAIRARGQRND